MQVENDLTESEKNNILNAWCDVIFKKFCSKGEWKQRAGYLTAMRAFVKITPAAFVPHLKALSAYLRLSKDAELSKMGQDVVVAVQIAHLMADILEAGVKIRSDQFYDLLDLRPYLQTMWDTGPSYAVLASVRFFCGSVGVISSRFCPSRCSSCIAPHSL